MRTLLLGSLVILSTACTTSREVSGEPKSVKADTQKPGAPTDLQSSVANSSVKLSLRFIGSGEHINVSVRGLDGVTVNASAEWLSNATVKAGEVRELTVPFTSTGRGHVVVSVEGDFVAGHRARVHTVAVGDGPVNDLGTVQKTDDGDTVKLVP